MIGILTDITKCVGCEKCVSACQVANKCDPERPEQKAHPGELFNTRWTSIVAKTTAGSARRFVRKHCRHCLNAACVSVCPVGAMKKTPGGQVIYDKSLCIGCRYCMLACPFGIPRSEWEKLAPGIKKCTFCFERTKTGGKPACTEACPEGATVFGTREELLIEAKKRISRAPGRYINKIYGETEFGGTAVLYVSDIPLDFLVLGDYLSNQPLPALTWAILKQTPTIAGAMGLTMGLLYMFWRRKQKVMHYQDQQKSGGK